MMEEEIEEKLMKITTNFLKTMQHQMAESHEWRSEQAAEACAAAMRVEIPDVAKRLAFLFNVMAWKEWIVLVDIEHKDDLPSHCVIIMDDPKKPGAVAKATRPMALLHGAPLEYCFDMELLEVAVCAGLVLDWQDKLKSIGALTEGD